MKKRTWVLVLLMAAVAVQAQTVKIAAEDDWYPFGGVVGGKLSGTTPPIIEAAFKAVGIKVEFVVVPYARAMAMADSGEVVGAFHTAIVDDLVERYHWHTTPLFRAKIAIWGRAESSERDSVRTLEGKTVGTTNGYTYTDTFDNNTKIKKEVAQSDLETLRKIALGRLNYGIVYARNGQALISANPSALKGKVKILGEVGEVPLYLNFSKAHTEGEKYAELFEKGLTTIIKNGEYAKIEAQMLNKLGLDNS